MVKDDAGSRAGLGISQRVATVSSDHADCSPESSRKGAAQCHMIRRLGARIANFTAIVVDDLFQQQVGLALDPTLHQEPPEEAHFWGALLIQMDL